MYSIGSCRFDARAPYHLRRINCAVLQALVMATQSSCNPIIQGQLQIVWHVYSKPYLELYINLHSLYILSESCKFNANRSVVDYTMKTDSFWESIMFDSLSKLVLRLSLIWSIKTNDSTAHYFAYHNSHESLLKLVLVLTLILEYSCSV